MTQRHALSLAIGLAATVCAGTAALTLSGPAAGQTQPRQESRLPIRGIVRALNQASISTDVPARVGAIGFREAQSFGKGDLLIRFDCERMQAEHAAAEAVHREMKLALDNNLALDRRGAVGRIEVEVSRARVDKAAAEAAALAARLKQCVIVAPFDGRVTELNINEHEFPAPGKPLLSIVDGRSFEIDIIVPSALLRRLGPETRLTFAVDETGRTHAARILRLGAAVDPVSQTAKVIAAFEDDTERILPGMSGTAIFGEAEAGQ